MRRLAILFSALALFAVSAMTAAGAEVRAVTDLDLERYLGKWYEQARIPVFFQAGCSNSTAEYRQISATTISVINSCDRFGRRAVIEGDAVVKGPGKLGVSFSRFVPFRADYWVLYVDKAYSTAVVGSPNRRVAWILTRARERSRESLAPALEALSANGYDVSRLSWD